MGRLEDMGARQWETGYVEDWQTSAHPPKEFARK